MATYQIFDTAGQVINTIVADLDFVEQQHLGLFKELVSQAVPTLSGARETNRAEAVRRLQETDWVEKPSVGDSTRNIWLSNVVEFLAYRDELRVIAVFAPSTDVIFPVKPLEVWKVNNGFVPPAEDSLPPGVVVDPDAP